MGMWSPEAMHAGTPMAPFGAPPFTPGAAMETTTALNWCQPLDSRMTNTSSTILRLERSRGQINKDITDMLKEAQEWRRAAEEAKRAGPTTPGAAAAALPEGAAEDDEAAPAPPKLPLVRGKTAPAPASSPTIVPTPKGTMTPPPGLLQSSMSFSSELPQLVVNKKEVDGKTVHEVKWRIDRVETKFRDCVGRPLVSQPFEVTDKVNLPELRLMVFPNLGLDVSGLTMKEQKSRYEALINEGPLTGALKLKVVTNFGERLVIKFNLHVGSFSEGPLQHDFADRIIHGCEFNSNWLKEFENGSLTVGVEILGVNEDATPEGGPAPGL